MPLSDRLFKVVATTLAVLVFAASGWWSILSDAPAKPWHRWWRWAIFVAGSCFAYGMWEGARSIR
jgi:hypothetical protein